MGASAAGGIELAGFERLGTHAQCALTKGLRPEPTRSQGKLLKGKSRHRAGCPPGILVRRFRSEPVSLHFLPPLEANSHAPTLILRVSRIAAGFRTAIRTGKSAGRNGPHRRHATHTRHGAPPRSAAASAGRASGSAPGRCTRPDAGSRWRLAGNDDRGAHYHGAK